MDPITLISMFVVTASLAAPVPRSYASCRKDDISLVGTQGFHSTEPPSWMNVDSQTVKLLAPVEDMVTGDARLLSEIEYYASLPDNWNGEGHPAVHSASLSAAESFIQMSLPSGLPLPRPMLGSSGLIEFYWDMPGGYVDVSFDEQGLGSLFVKARNGQEEFYADLYVSDITKQWLATRLNNLHSNEFSKMAVTTS